MPRLSVVVPHRRDDQRLESTLLTVLENRPSDCEVIVVHDGSYADPYDLADEVVFVDTEPNANVIAKLNAGLMAACSPHVGFVLDGVLVTEDWAEESLEILDEDPQVASVAVGIRRLRRTTYGLASRSITNAGQLRRGDLLQKKTRESSACPEISCGVFRKSVLLALNGFAHESLCQAELDFAYSIESLQLTSLCDTETIVEDNNSNGRPRGLAKVASEHGVIRAGLIAALLDLPTGALQCPSGVVSWFSEQASASTQVAAKRIADARKQLDARQQDDSDATYRFSLPAATKSPRRAA